MNHTPSTPDTPLDCNAFDEIVSDYLEHTLDPAASAAAAAHVAGCARCGDLAAELAEIQSEARRLPVLKPSHDLWNAISARIDTPPVAIHGGSSRAWWRRTAGLAAAALVLVAGTAAVTWKFAQSERAPIGVERSPVALEAASDVRPAAVRVAAAYDSEIATLRGMLVNRPGGLDSATARVLAANLKVIDDAIGRMRVALDSMPASALLSQQLARAYDMKLNTLRQYVAMGTE